MKGRDGTWHPHGSSHLKAGPAEMWPLSPSCTLEPLSHTHTPHMACLGSAGVPALPGSLGAPPPPQCLVPASCGVAWRALRTPWFRRLERRPLQDLPPSRSPCSPSPAPAPAVLLPSKVMWEGRWWDWTCDQGGQDGEEGKPPDPCEHHDPPSPLRGGGSFTQEQGSLREVRAQLIQNPGDLMGGLGWGGAGDGQSSHNAETADT